MLDRNFVFENFDKVLTNQKNRGLVGLSEKKMKRFYVLEKKRRFIKNIIKENKYPILSFMWHYIEDILEEKVHDIEVNIAAYSDEDVPIGKDSSDNIVVKEWGKVDGTCQPRNSHVDLGKNKGILDFDRADKVAKHMNVFYLGMGAKLERALYNFMLDTHTEKGQYIEMITPYIVDERIMYNSGLYPRFQNEFFRTTFEDYTLIPSAAESIEGYHADEIIDAADLPLSYVSLSPCFRVEHGECVAWVTEDSGYGEQSLIRNHQFHKVELHKYTHPDESENEMLNILSDAEKILKKLSLPYRVVKLCTGDTTFSVSKAYDIEVWMPHINDYIEVSSVYNKKDFCSRRANVRFYDKKSKKYRFVHNVTGSGLAVGRITAAVIENYQQDDGTIKVPEVLKRYLGDVEYI